MKLKFLIFSILFINCSVAAQQSPHTFVHRDTSIHSIKDFFKKSQLHGHVRNYFMATINEGELKDYWSNATGGAIKIESTEWYGLQLGVKGTFAYQTLSADLNEVDTLVGKSAKWEKELYDVNRPGETNRLNRLEELYIKWNFGRSYVTFGKIDINKGPLFLRRDGRMNPFVYSGAWAEVEEFSNHKITLGWINGIASRGMTEWFSLSEVIGMNNNGYLPDGDKAHYYGHLATKGIGVIGIENSSIADLKIQYWNFFFQNLFDMHWLQLDYQKNKWIGGLQYVYQQPSKQQQQLDYANRYMQPDERGNVINLLIGHEWSSIELAAIYLHSFGKGRFLYPKELGRENFYASQSISWIDGYGATDVWMVKIKYQPTQEKWKNLSLDTRLSYTNPATTLACNKYGKIPFCQATFLAKYAFTQELDGMELTVRYVTKYASNNKELTLSQRYYKTNFHHFNVIMNIHF